MTISQSTARKEIFAHIAANWVGAEAIVDYLPEIRWQGLEEGSLPGTGRYWMRASTQNVITTQAAHAITEVGVSDVIYRTVGFVTLQVFAPMSVRGSYEKGELLSDIGQRMFMATETASAVWFRNPRIRELANDGSWHRWNVISDYEFDQSRSQNTNPIIGPALGNSPVIADDILSLIASLDGAL
jgi:hypothetical protein